MGGGSCSVYFDDGCVQYTQEGLVASYNRSPTEPPRRWSAVRSSSRVNKEVHTKTAFTRKLNSVIFVRKKKQLSNFSDNFVGLFVVLPLVMRIPCIAIPGVGKPLICHHGDLDTKNIHLIREEPLVLLNLRWVRPYSFCMVCNCSLTTAVKKSRSLVIYTPHIPLWLQKIYQRPENRRHLDNFCAEGRFNKVIIGFTFVSCLMGVSTPPKGKETSCIKKKSR